MAASTGTSGTTLEGLLNDDSEAITLASLFANSKLAIVSPSVAGLLDSFNFENKEILGIEACGSGFESDSEIQKANSLIFSINKKEAESSVNLPEKSDQFIGKAVELRAQFSKNSLQVGTSTAAYERESYENVFMRMIGLPDEMEAGQGQSRISYIDPAGGAKGTIKVATITELTGASQSTSSTGYSAILKERQTINKKFDFSNIKKSQAEYDDAIVGMSKADIERVVNFYNPNDLIKFFYLKSVPLQDSNIYRSIYETEKIVSKPFESKPFRLINGEKIKTSLLESILKIRLDSITGGSAIYSSETNEIGIAKNVGADKITATECFLIEKFKKILFQIGDKYSSSSISEEEEYLLMKSETEITSDTTGDPDLTSNKDKIQPILNTLEILKAREDAIILLLKETSSSSNVINSDAAYSSMQTQQVMIGALSGVQDVLSGPMLAVLSQKSEYLGDKITELRALLDSSKKVETDGPKNDPAAPRSDNSFIGICAEDFIIYILSLLSINEDYLIGLLSKDRRTKLAKIISNSILTSNKDPYGIIDRVNKDQNDGGYPSVLDSVNALSVLVANYYRLYINYIIEDRKKAIDDKNTQAAINVTFSVEK
jgi:hypothetical protein